MGWLTDIFSSESSQTVKPKNMDINQRRVYDDANELWFGTSDTAGERFDPEYYVRNNPEVAQGLGININQPLTAKDLKKVERYHRQYRDFDPFYYIKKNPELAAQLGITEADITPDGTKEQHDRVEANLKKLKQHYKNTGQYEGLAGNDYQMYDPEAAPIKSYEDRFAEDFGYSQGANQSYLDSILGSNNQYSGTLQNLVDRDTRISEAPMQLTGAGLSGPMSFTSGTQRNADRNIANYGGIINQLGKENAQAQNVFDATYTPNALENAWMNVLRGEDNANFNERMAQATTTTTQTPSVMDALTGVLSMLSGGISGGADIWNAFNQGGGGASSVSGVGPISGGTVTV